MVACQGYGCLARSLDQQDARDAQEERTEGQGGGGRPLVAPVPAAVAVPVVALFAGMPLDIIRAALEPSRRRAAT